MDYALESRFEFSVLEQMTESAKLNRTKYSEAENQDADLKVQLVKSSGISSH